jgi:hypothetical protein
MACRLSSISPATRFRLRGIALAPHRFGRLARARA